MNGCSNIKLNFGLWPCNQQVDYLLFPLKRVNPKTGSGRARQNEDPDDPGVTEKVSSTTAHEDPRQPLTDDSNDPTSGIAA